MAYEWDDLTAASEHYATAIRLREHANFKVLRDATLGLALTEYALGDPGAAHQAVDELLRFGDAVQGPHYAGVIRSFKARLLLLGGDVARATHFINMVEHSVVQPATVLDIEVPRLTRAQALVAQGSAAALRHALLELSDLAHWHSARHEGYFATRALALQALALQSQGNPSQALTVLGRAVAMAAEGQLVRSFVDLGPPMRDLLRELNTDDPTATYVGHLLEHFPGTTTSTALGEGPRTELMASLTTRETEILELLVRRLSNKEIAQRLLISDHTVKRHTVSLYQKLQVDGRHAAVARAVSLGLAATK